MKKLLLIIAFMTAGAIYFLNAQVIENFELIPLNVMLGGPDDQSTMTVIDNPDPSGINNSNTVVEFVRDMDGVPWGGFWSPLPNPVDLTYDKYVHVKVWKTRISPIKFKVENGTSGTLEIFSMNPQTTINAWEEIVFDFSSMTGTYPTVVFMPDYEDPLTLTEDITIYFDEIIVNNDPTPGSAAVIIIEDFEYISLNIMLAGGDDNSMMTVVENPNPAGINTSSRVVEFLRDKDGLPWGGFWSILPVPLDLTTNKYIHVKVWKPRISPIKFKIEGGGGMLEIFSLNEQTIINGWQDMVFDFSSMTGPYLIISFMPDFEDPLTLTDDITIYFDDIILNNSPVPISPNVNFTVNMTGAIGLPSEIPFDPSFHEVYLSGDFAGWPEPGSNPTLKLSSTDQVHYTISLPIDDGHIQFKYFFTAPGEITWYDGEWFGTDNRHHIVQGETTFDHVWGDRPVLITFVVDMTYADPFNPETDDVYMSGELLSNWNEPGTIFDYKMSPIAGNEMNYLLTLPLYKEDHDYKYFRVINYVPGWDNGEWPGEPYRSITVTTEMTEFDIWGLFTGIHEYAAVPLHIYPNPVHDQLIIDNLENAKRIEIFTVTGEKSLTMGNFSTPTMIINTSCLSKGLYLLLVYYNNEVRSTKFIK